MQTPMKPVVSPENAIKDIEIRIRIFVALLILIAVTGYVFSPLPHKERAVPAIIFLMLALTAFIFRKPLARFEYRDRIRFRRWWNHLLNDLKSYFS